MTPMDTGYMRKLKHLHNVCTMSKFTYYLWMDIIGNVSMVAYLSGLSYAHLC